MVTYTLKHQHPGAFDDTLPYDTKPRIRCWMHLTGKLNFTGTREVMTIEATVQVQTNENGAGWVTRGTYAENGPDVNSGGTQVWNQETLDLTGLISGSSTQLRFLVTFPSSGTAWHNDFGLDTITITASDPSGETQAATEEITINQNGLYHISYGVTSIHTAAVNERWGEKTRIQIDSGSGYSNAPACYGDTFSRGTSAVDHFNATAATSCILELEKDDTIRVVALREGDAIGGADHETVANQVYLSIHSFNISNPPLQDTITFADTVQATLIKNLFDTITLVDTVETTYDASVSLTETLTLADGLLIDKDGQVLVTFEETLTLSDGTVEKLVQPLKPSGTITFVDQVSATFAGSVTLTETLTLDDGIATAEIFFPSSPDFKIQHDVFTISDASTSGTITEGIDFDECTGDCFIMQVGTRQTGMGTTSGGGNQNADDVTTYISNIDGLSTTSGTVTFTRAGSTNDNRLGWQIIEYIGPVNGPNEMEVLDTGVCSFGSTSDSCTGSTISGGASDDGDVAVIITGVSNPDIGVADYETGLVTTEWKGASNVPVFNRTATGSDAIDVSYAVVEFTGPNWNLQRVEHEGSDLGLEQSESITDVGDLSRAFVLQAQQRNADSATSDGLCEVGERVWLSDTDTVSFSNTNLVLLHVPIQMK